jgi:hypothetical protein
MEAFMSWDLEIRDDLYPLTHPEDGEERTFSAFYVIATEVTTGRRFSHDFVFRSARLVDGEDGPTIAGHREDALLAPSIPRLSAHTGSRCPRPTGH